VIASYFTLPCMLDSFNDFVIRPIAYLKRCAINSPLTWLCAITVDLNSLAEQRVRSLIAHGLSHLAPAPGGYSTAAALRSSTRSPKFPFLYSLLT
jgi:hypothetical protein